MGGNLEGMPTHGGKSLEYKNAHLVSVDDEPSSPRYESLSVVERPQSSSESVRFTVIPFYTTPEGINEEKHFPVLERFLVHHNESRKSRS